MILLALTLALASSALPQAPPPGFVPTAEEDARARELYDNGVLLYEEGRYEDAVAAWTEAYRLSGRSLLLFNMANAMERLGRYDEAMELLSRYRAFAPAEEREVLDRRIRNIEARLMSSPAPTTVASTQDPVPTPTPAPARKTPSVRVLPLALGGVGLVGIGTGGAFGIAALAARASAAESCVEVDGVTRCAQEAGSALAADQLRSLVADAAFGVGVLGVAGAVVTAVLPGREAAVTGGWGPRGGWLGLQAGF